jgi:hypothetical protein
MIVGFVFIKDTFECSCWVLFADIVGSFLDLEAQSGRDSGALATHCTKTGPFLLGQMISPFLSDVKKIRFLRPEVILVPFKEFLKLLGNLGYKSVKKALIFKSPCATTLRVVPAQGDLKIIITICEQYALPNSWVGAL